MTSNPDAPTYWLDLFTEETYIEAAQYGFRVSGFSAGRWTTVARMRRGDLLVCYLTGHSAYVGLLRVTGEPYQDESPIWRSQVFPSRVPVERVLTLHPEHGVPVRSLSDHLTYFRNLSHPIAWTGYFRGSPAQIRPEDAAVIEAALREAGRNEAHLLDLSKLPTSVESRQRRKSASEAQELSDQATDKDIEALVAPPEPLPLTEAIEPIVDEEERLAQALVRTSSDSDDSRAFEEAILAAFRFLGFRAEHRSGAGDTDVLVVAPLGEAAYGAVIDAKSSRHRRIANSSIEWLGLERHLRLHSAHHILVVAPGFSGGDLLDNAERTQVALITAQDLGEVLRLHARTPFSLEDLRDLFRYPGKPEAPLERLRARATELARLQQLLPDILESIREAYGYKIFTPVTPDILLFTLAHRRHGMAYSREEIANALDLLSMPQIGALRRVTEASYALQMPQSTVARRLRSLVRVHDAGEVFAESPRITDTRRVPKA